MAKALNITLSIFGIILLLGVLGVLYMGYWQSNTIGENLVLNPGFETGSINPSSWIFTGDGINYIGTLDNEESSKGEQSISFEVVNQKRNWNSWYQSESVAVNPGKKYIFSIDYKLEGIGTHEGVSDSFAISEGYDICYDHPEGCNERLSFYICGSDQQDINLASCDPRTEYKPITNSVGYNNHKEEWVDGGWVTITGSRIINPSTTYISPRMFFYSNEGKVWYDNLVIKEAKSCTSNWQCTFDNECKDSQCSPLDCGSEFKEGFHKCNIILGETAGIQEPIQLSQD